MQPRPAGRRRRARPRIGLALAGGGPLGAVYEIGALNALADCLRGVNFNDLDVYVGVSSGAFLAAALANGIPPAQMSRMFIESATTGEPFAPSMLLKPAYREYAQRALSIPPLVVTALWRYLADAEELSLLGWVERFGRALPTGIFDGRAIDRYLRGLFARPGRTNDFRTLARSLYLVATDLDSGASVEFGAAGHDHVPISTAVQASAALPGLFPPIEIEGRHYVDGALRKTLHASVALKHGARLVLCINPLVPYHSDAAQRHPAAPARLVHGGLPAVLGQTFRALVHSRMQVGMQRYAVEYKHADVLLFEPDRQDAEMFVTNIFSYANRRRLAEHAYQRTRRELFERRHAIAPILARHGIELDLEALTDSERRLVRAARRHSRPSTAMRTAHRLDETLGDLERWLRQASLVG
ncbi:MAG TPA: patatin-like phospholipase family protein [Burkholderiales bacterium]|jgi:predicted acylesterase/phospholipase RssA